MKVPFEKYTFVKDMSGGFGQATYKCNGCGSEIEEGKMFRHSEDCIMLHMKEVIATKKRKNHHF